MESVLITAIAPEAQLPGDDLVPSAGDADASAVERFENLMDGESTAVPSAQNVNPPAGTWAGDTLGARILKGVQALSGNLEQAQKGMSDLLTRQDFLSPQSMIAFQFQMVSVTMQYDVLSKATGKTVDGIRQLVTQQQ
jgi:hypothetical protein